MKGRFPFFLSFAALVVSLLFSGSAQAHPKKIERTAKVICNCITKNHSPHAWPCNRPAWERNTTLTELIEQRFGKTAKLATNEASRPVNVVFTRNVNMLAPVVDFSTAEQNNVFAWRTRHYRLYRDFRRGHRGLDINPAKRGTLGMPVESLADGTIWSARKGHKRYGDWTSADHGSHFCETGHYHPGTMLNPRTGQEWKEGDQVFRGDILALMGETGNASNVHTHYQCREKKPNGKPGKLINPKTCHPELNQLQHSY